MLNTFENAQSTTSRRQERERQLELMNHAANGTGPFAADAIDSGLDVDLDIDESLMLDVEGVNPTMYNRGAGNDVMNPDEARKAALAALRAADRDHVSTQRSAGMGEGRLNSDRRFQWNATRSQDEGFEIDSVNDNDMYETDLNTAHNEAHMGSIKGNRRTGGGGRGSNVLSDFFNPSIICCTVRGKRVSRNLALLAGLIVAIVVIIGASVGSTAGKRGEQQPIVASTEQSSGGSSLSNEETARLTAYTDLLVNLEISMRSDLERMDSPHNKAIMHLVKDGNNVYDLAVENDQEQMISKYGLVLLYFTNVGDPSHFLEGKIPDAGQENEEDDRDANRDSETDPKGPIDHTHDWLSESDGKDPPHCHWTGVKCYDPTEEGVGLGVVKSLNLTMRGLVGTIEPDVPRALKDILSLDMGYNSLSGSIPETVRSMTFLKQLYLGGNDLNGSIPNTIGELKQLEDLYLQENSLTGSIPQEIGYLAQLDGLGLYENNLNGKIPDTIGSLVNLFVLYLDDNELTGAIPSSVQNLKQLIDFRVRKNKLNGRIPPEVGGMAALELFYVDNNDLIGPIPETLSLCENLKQIHLYKNELTGKIPGNLGQLNGLELFYADNNKLTGSIPEQLGYLLNLESLYLFNNQLNETLPATLGQLNSLTQLRLNNNKLQGPLPASLGDLTKVELFFVDGNELEGQIPPELAGMARLEQWRLHNNNFVGGMPQEICNLRNGELDDLTADCGVNNLVDCAAPDCCTQCY